MIVGVVELEYERPGLALPHCWGGLTRFEHCLYVRVILLESPTYCNCEGKQGGAVTVYVDDMLRVATVQGMRRRWSHLMADDPAELRAFAHLIGLKMSWLQQAGCYREHFDVTEAVRLRAIKRGAVIIRFEDAPELHRKLRDRERRMRETSRPRSSPETGPDVDTGRGGAKLTYGCGHGLRREDASTLTTVPKTGERHADNGETTASSTSVAAKYRSDRSANPPSPHPAPQLF